MVSQKVGGCRVCGNMTHTQMYHKPKKPLKRSPLSKIGKKLESSKTKLSKNYKVPKRRTESRSQLVKKLDSTFSQWVRLRDAVEVAGELQATCVTCGDTKLWKLQQNAHFYSRGKYPTRWDEDNCHVGCYRCNVILGGNYIEYTTWMIDKYGRGFVDELKVKATSGAKISTPELRELITHYNKKVGAILNEN